MITPALTTTYKQLQDMDKQITEGEAHIRVLKEAQFPGTLKLQADLEKAKASRQALMTAIQNEQNRPS